METATHTDALTPALEDYLETLWEILQHKKVAQITEVAERRNVNVASVTPAMKRLMRLGLVDYNARAYIDLTPAGVEVARRVKSRHDLIKRFLTEVLGVSEAHALDDACAAEHMFSNETIDRLVRFFEYIERCDTSESQFLKRFLSCSVVHPEKENQGCSCGQITKIKRQGEIASESRYLSSLRPGDTATILQVVAEPLLRQLLIDKGLVSGRRVRVVRLSYEGDTFSVQVGTDDVTLSIREAACVLVSG